MAHTDILIADDFHPLLLQKLDEVGIGYNYQPEIERKGILDLLSQGAKGLVIRSKIHVDEEIIDTGAGLTFIARGGAGMDNVDESYATAKGIECFNTGEANSDAVGEHTIGLLLSLFHKITKADAEVRQGKWLREANRGLELSGKTIGIIGYGNTGSAVAKKLSGFNMRILAYDKFKTGFGNDYVKEVKLEEIFQLADILTLHIPLNSHTKNMVTSEYIQQFVRNIFLLNLSRGGIVNVKDVIYNLQNGKILGFGADVLPNENPSAMGDTDKKWFEELTQRNDVVLTPHVAGWTVESYEKISAVLASKICLKVLSQ